MNGQPQSKNKRTVLLALGVVVGMFGFGFALVPLYNVFCELTGINGKTGPKYVLQSGELEADLTRVIKVQFVTQNNEAMPWHFKPAITQVEVHPGELMQVEFIARNPTSQDMVAQAVPSLSPNEGTDYFHKIECFCFTRQALKAGEETRMPLRFVVDKDLPEYLTKLTLSYTLFDQPVQNDATVSGEAG
ncbi:cytochrome c oxidase assembly protein [Alkalimarinus coralli]|uniref:cytochrome c oxidase assembly protein n=1 Tax=Alkalimarinus coralli TaxID=2935863 RepID=UPI00202AD204|nr:cytochrome c oxidase assembly protein [Alkalimarinus coralli]